MRCVSPSHLAAAVTSASSVAAAAAAAYVVPWQSAFVAAVEPQTACPPEIHTSTTSVLKIEKHTF